MGASTGSLSRCLPPSTRPPPQSPRGSLPRGRRPLPAAEGLREGSPCFEPCPGAHAGGELLRRQLPALFFLETGLGGRGDRGPRPSRRPRGPPRPLPPHPLLPPPVQVLLLPRLHGEERPRGGRVPGRPRPRGGALPRSARRPRPAAPLRLFRGR